MKLFKIVIIIYCALLVYKANVVEEDKSSCQLQLQCHLNKKPQIIAQERFRIPIFQGVGPRGEKGPIGPEGPPGEAFNIRSLNEDDLRWLASLALDSRPRVAFFVGLKDKPTKSPKYNETRLKMDSLITNFGGGYDLETGLFVTPASGLYIFSITISATEFRQAAVFMNWNDRKVIEVLAAGYPWATSSTQCILDLKEGDLIELKARTNENYTYPCPFMYSSFSGYLLP